VYPLINIYDILNYTVEMCYNNVSVAEVCVLHSIPMTFLMSASLPFHGTPRNCLTPQRLIFAFTLFLLVLLDQLWL